MDDQTKLAKEDTREHMNDRWLWPHLENIERIQKEREVWFDQNAIWVVTEKIHGFNARFGLDLDGTPWAGGRNQVAVEGDPGQWDRGKLQGFIGFAADMVQQGILAGQTLFGEWAGKGIQKGIDYGERDFYMFGAMCDEGHLLAWDEVTTIADVLGIKTVPVLYHEYGLPSIEKLNEWREAKSLIAETGREGICLTQDPPVRDGWGHYLIGKFKAAAFAENAHAQKPLRELPDMANVVNFVADYATAMRLEHVLAQVGEELTAQFDNVHKDPLDVVNTGRVMREMYEDVVREAGSEYDALADEDKKMLGKVLSQAAKKLLDAARVEAMK
jgi:hypothetical protein